MKVNGADGMGTTGGKFKLAVVFNPSAGFLCGKRLINPDQKLSPLQHGTFACACQQHTAFNGRLFRNFQIERRPHPRFRRLYIGMMILNILYPAFGSSRIQRQLIADCNALPAQGTGYRNADPFQRKHPVDIQERFIRRVRTDGIQQFRNLLF